MTRHRRAPLWCRLIQRPAPVVESTTEAVTEPMPTSPAVPAAAEALAVAGLRRAQAKRQHTPQPDRAHLDRHGPLLPPGAVVPPPAMPGGAG